MSSLGDLESVEKVSPTPRKRKLRKGTQSCWECKRRKTRCFYAAPAESTCLGCRSRNIKCISQEFEEDLLAAGPEAMTEPARKRTNASAARPVQRRGERTLKIAPVSWEALPLYGPSSETASVMLEPYQETYFALAEVWPATCDLSLAYSAAFKNSYMLRGPFFSPYSKSCYQNELSPQEVLQLPPTGSHPVLFARKLLLLSDLFQQVPSETCEDAAHLHGMAMQILDRVAALVTTNDELISSVEGIECVALESMIHNNRGSLQRALFSLRNAMLLAQLMGLHRPEQRSSLKFVEPMTQTRIDTDFIWFRLVESDRYLSLMLGVPQACTDNSFLERRQLEECSPMEQFERLLLIVSGRILDRNEHDIQNLGITQEIDELLRSASTCMLPQWWLCPTFKSEHEDESMLTKRFMLQFTYYFLLTQLHFPYLLSPSDDDFHTFTNF